MEQKTIYLILILCTLFTTTEAQNTTDSLQVNTSATTREKMKIKQFLVPGTLIIAGTTISGSQLEKNIKNSMHDGSVNDIDFALPIDDLIQYVPTAELYVADALGVKAKNHWFDQTKYLIIANAITAGITQAGKYIINKERPNGADHSFPSGHSSFSFTNASVLYFEFRESSPGFASSGYIITSLVAGLRVVNNRHWLSDVMVGSGLGILVSTMVYHYEPLKNWNPFKNTKDIIFVPSYNNGRVGAYFCYTF